MQLVVPQHSTARLDALVQMVQEILKLNHTLPVRESRELMNRMEHLLCEAGQLSWLSHLVASPKL